MKFYNGKQGSNPQKVRMFLKEKGIELPTVSFDLMKQEHRTAEYLAVNSLGKLPALELDDGSILTESLAICRYLESLYPEPALFGDTPETSARVEMWCRRVEWELSLPVVNALRHSAPFFADAIEQIPEFASSQRQAAAEAFVWLDSEMSDGRAFVAGEAFSMADILLITTVGNARMVKIELPETLTHVHAWYERMQQRPSVSA